jgi:hypothetical protein
MSHGGINTGVVCGAAATGINDYWLAMALPDFNQAIERFILKWFLPQQQQANSGSVK